MILRFKLKKDSLSWLIKEIKVKDMFFVQGGVGLKLFQISSLDNFIYRHMINNDAIMEHRYGDVVTRLRIKEFSRKDKTITFEYVEE